MASADVGLPMSRGDTLPQNRSRAFARQRATPQSARGPVHSCPDRVRSGRRRRASSRRGASQAQRSSSGPRPGRPPRRRTAPVAAVPWRSAPRLQPDSPAGRRVRASAGTQRLIDPGALHTKAVAKCRPERRGLRVASHRLLQERGRFFSPAGLREEGREGLKPSRMNGVEFEDASQDLVCCIVERAPASLIRPARSR